MALSFRFVDLFCFWGLSITCCCHKVTHTRHTLDKVLDMLKQVVPNLKAPVVLFTYYNPILKHGPEVFMKAVKAAGASGLVVPDLPLEETDKLCEFTFANDLELILLTTPTTPQNCAKVIAQASEGFVYLVSLTGVTGACESVHSRVQSLLKDLKQVTTKSVAVGFGISLPEHASQVKISRSWKSCSHCI
ncbi:hypothetical protein BDL97_13G072800 [Sphagnum fallax]|nr:hypothetical protein BDL97_13G072800 [Sphagnum fallax]